MPDTCRFALAALPLLATFGCASHSEAGPPDAASLVGEWTVESIAGRGVVDGSPAYVAFDAEGALHGNASCNRFHGTWSLADGGLWLSPLATTRMAGPPELMDQETRLLDALARAERVAVDGGELVLSAAGGDELLRASRRESR